MLTPLDIDNKEFSRQLKGYSVTEVDDFLDEISDNFEILLKENLEFEDRLIELEKDVEQYKAVETTLQDTLILAQKTADDVKEVAKTEAEAILEAAQKHAKITIEEMNLEIQKKTERLRTTKEELNIFKAKMESLLISQLELLSDLDSDELVEEMNRKYISDEKFEDYLEFEEEKTENKTKIESEINTSLFDDDEDEEEFENDEKIEQKETKREDFSTRYEKLKKEKEEERKKRRKQLDKFYEFADEEKIKKDF